MFSKKELQLVYGLGVVLLVVGVISYAAFSAKPPEQPVRIMYTVGAGNVLFDHKTHSAASGYALSCGDCHHTLEEDEYEEAGACIECHDPDEGDEEVPKLADAFHQQCAGCHEDFGAGPANAECTKCHVM